LGWTRVEGVKALGKRAGRGVSLVPPMINTSKAYHEYVVYVDSKALRGRGKAEPSRGDASEIDCAKRSPKGVTAWRRRPQYLRHSIQSEPLRCPHCKGPLDRVGKFPPERGPPLCRAQLARAS